MRFLAENAGSMDPIHFDAFCQLLSLQSTDHKKFLWDVSRFGAPIQRGRNFCRGHDDFEDTVLDSTFFPDGWGPLVNKEGQVLPLAPLLRTRSSEAYGIYRSSWTFYQPKALIGTTRSGEPLRTLVRLSNTMGAKFHPAGGSGLSLLPS